MYAREILAPRGSPIEDRTPIEGTWDKAFSHVNLMDIHRPYRWPIPRWLKDCRIKEWEAFSVQDNRFVLEAFLGNIKLCRAAQVILYNKESGENFVFRKFMLPSGRRLPRSLAHESVECRSPRFFFRVHTWLNADTIDLELDVAETWWQPAFAARLAFGMESRDVTPSVVSLKFTERRNMYAYKALAPVRGDIVLGSEHFSLDPAQCSGIFRDYKGFFPYRMRGVFCGAMGFDAEGRRYGFHVAENQAREPRRNNENAMWVNGQLSPLPPVLITMSGGPESNWVIQDVDGMVDITFSPSQQYRLGANLLAVSGDLFAALGYYNGMLIGANGEQVQVKNQWGLGEKLYLRV